MDLLNLTTLETGALCVTNWIIPHGNLVEPTVQYIVLDKGYSM